MAAAADAGGFDFVGFVEGGDIPSRPGRCDRDRRLHRQRRAEDRRRHRQADLAISCAKRSTPRLLSRIAALLALTSLKRLQKRIDPRRVNGGVFLGLNGTVVKSHGSADATGVVGGHQAGLPAGAVRLSGTACGAGCIGRSARGRMPPQEPSGRDREQSDRMTIRAVVRGVGHYLPDRVVPNAEFEAIVDTSRRMDPLPLRDRAAAFRGRRPDDLRPCHPRRPGRAGRCRDRRPTTSTRSSSPPRPPI